MHPILCQVLYGQKPIPNFHGQHYSKSYFPDLIEMYTEKTSATEDGDLLDSAHFEPKHVPIYTRILLSPLPTWHSLVEMLRTPHLPKDTFDLTIAPLLRHGAIHFSR